MSQPTAAGDTAPALMRAVVVTRPGGLDALESKDVPVPVRKPGRVRIKVKAFGVNESEVTTRKGESDAVVTYPRVPGIECVGVVDEADEDSGLRPGQQVATMMGGMGRSYDGAYAQYVTVPAAQVIPFETGLPWEVLGALPEMFQTAYGSLAAGLGPAGGADAADPRRHLDGRAERGHDREGPGSHRAVHHPQPGQGRGTAGRGRRPSPRRPRHHRRPGARTGAGRCRRRAGVAGCGSSPTPRPVRRHATVLHRRLAGHGRSPTSVRS